MQFNRINNQTRIPNPKHDVYFEGNKKNQLNQLKGYFKSILSNPDLSLYRKQVIKKIISYTTSGIDTSRFYPQMVLASASKDIVQKKLIFFFLSIHSHHNPDFSRMAINTFMKDADSPNPNIRALAIRHLSDLRFKGRQQYVMPKLKQGLNDFSSIVKKACLMGLTKLITQQNRKRSQPLRDQELLNQLYGMLRDSDPYVVCCTIQAINEIQPEGIAMSKKLTHYLIKNLSNFEQMQLTIILNYVQLYDPKQQQEILQFLNKLDSKIRTQNLSLLLSIIKIYLKYGKISQNLMPQIQGKIKPCLLSFIPSRSSQVQYIALKQILHLIKKYQIQHYVNETKKFYIRQNDPTYIKLCKIELMQINCRKSNFGDIINEFSEYLKDPDIIDEVMEAFNAIILRLDLNEAKVIIKTLNDIVANMSNKQYICNASIKTMRTFLRRYPEEFKIFQNTFYIYVRGVSTTSARCAMVEIIGDFGQFIEDAVELIVWSESNIEDQLKIALLRANVKLFFKRPIEMLNIISKLFRDVLTDQQTRMPVKDYAAMLYRGLQNDIQSFKKSFLSCRTFSQGIKLPCKQLQFNTLQIIYEKPKSQWLIQKTKYIQLLDPIQYEQTNGQTKEQQQSYQVTLQKNRSKVDISSQYSKIQADDIDKQFVMTAEQFEVYWQQYQIGSSITRMINSSQIELITQQTLEELFRLWSVSVIASVQSKENIKQYLFFKLNKGDIICMELTVTKQVETLALIVKTQNEELAGFAAKYVEDFIKLNQII